MTTFFCYLNMVPNVVWAAGTASMLTLIGVFLTNRHFSKQQQAQLDHEKNQNDISRKFDLRRSVYLEAAVELNKAFQHLSAMASIDLAEENPAGGISNFFSAGSKACLVASDGTAKAINDLIEAYARTFFELLSKLSPIQDARTDRNLENDVYQKYWAEVKR